MRRRVSFLTHGVGGVWGLCNLQGLAGAEGGGPGTQPIPQDHKKGVSFLTHGVGGLKGLPIYRAWLVQEDDQGSIS